MNEETKTISVLDCGRRVLQTEGKGLLRLSEELNESFIKAVTVLTACKGRVIVSGMGKSGHIARKIAATLASTGTPAFFVHPGEASHGDLGMITEHDCVFALSNSGEAVELGDLIAYSRRFAIPLIACTARAESTLAQAADIILLVPALAEACPLGLAPTTSTTMMLALGDALAVALLEYKGFTADDYRNFHPGGKLGKRLLRVSDIMHGAGEIPLANLGDTMDNVLLVMTAKRFGCIGIIEANGSLCGIITDGDLRRHMDEKLLTKHASEIMTANPLTVAPKMLAAEALNILNTKQLTQLFIVDGVKPVGILHIHDLLRAGIA